MYGDESFNGLIKINFDGNRISVKRSDNHYKYLVGAKRYMIKFQVIIKLYKKLSFHVLTLKEIKKI